MTPQCSCSDGDGGFRLDLRRYRPILKFIIPFMHILLLIYGEWAFIHKFCIRLLYDYYGYRATGIALLVTVSCLLCLVLLIWAQILYVGAGKQETIPPFRIIEQKDARGTIVPPLVYQCDPNGFPMWCSQCQSIKNLRTHHSSDSKHCVPKFDHYCGWLGTSVGRDNYRLFVQFLIYMTILLLLFWIPIVCFIKTGYHDGNLVAVVVLSILGSLFTSALLLEHLFYISRNITTLEMLSLKKKKKQNGKTRLRYVCYFDEISKERHVIELYNKDFVTLWNQGSIWKNWQDAMGSQPIWWIVPHIGVGRRKNVGMDIEQLYDADIETLEDIPGIDVVHYNPKMLEMLDERIANGDYIKRFKAWGDESD